MSGDFQFIRSTVTNRIGWLEYHRPPINAFTAPMVDEVAAALKAHLADPAVRVIVLASAVEKYFSAGADMEVFRGMTAEGMAEWVDRVHGIVRTMRASPKPLLAAIHGTAVGGGLEMTLHCDVRFCADDARLGQPEIAIGFIPPIGTTQALARLLGRPRAIRYLYDGQLISAATALEWGLVDELAPRGELRARVQAYAESLAAKPAEALKAIRATVTEGGSLPFRRGLEIERAEVIRLASTPDFAEGVSAFLQKRKPKFND
jgi:enoyl-CoA hydratase/carnithine racemase